MKEAMPYLNIYATAEIPEDMKDEVEAEQAAKAEAAETSEETTEEETTTEEGTLVDPNTGEVVKMPTEEEAAADEDSGPVDDYDSPILSGDGTSDATE